MKTLKLIGLVLLLPVALIAQDSTLLRQQSIKALTSHGHLIEFIGNSMSNTDEVQLYMQRNFDCAYINDTHTIAGNGSVIYKYNYIRRVPGEKAQTPIHFNFTVNKNNKIDKVVIKGNWVDLAELFLFYWPTTVTAEEIKKKRTAVERLMSDKIIYEASGADQATITIVHI